jgi:hypothetical protein
LNILNEILGGIVKEYWNGYSKKYTNQELNDFVERERDKQHNSEDSDYSFWFKFGVVAAIISISAIFGFIFIWFIKKNSRAKRKE